MKNLSKKQRKEREAYANAKVEADHGYNDPDQVYQYALLEWDKEHKV